MNGDRIAVLIKTASIEFDKMANPILAEYDLTASQCRILKFLFMQQNQSARIVDIEKECVITHPTVLGLLDSLAFLCANPSRWHCKPRSFRY